MSALIPIQSVTVGTSTASVTFSSIPTTVSGRSIKDLVLVGKVTGTSDIRVYMNGIGTGSSYYTVYGFGSGSGVGNQGWTGGINYCLVANAPSTYDMSFEATFGAFAATDKYKTIISRYSSRAASGAGGYVGLMAGAMRYTAAVTSLTLTTPGGGNVFATGSTFDLYGVQG